MLYASHIGEMRAFSLSVDIRRYVPRGCIDFRRHVVNEKLNRRYQDASLRKSFITVAHSTGSGTDYHHHHDHHRDHHEYDHGSKDHGFNKPKEYRNDTATVAHAIVGSMDLLDDDSNHSDGMHHNHNHALGCCTGHESANPLQRNIIYRMLLWIYRKTKLYNISSWMEHNIYSNAIKLVFFLIAAGTLWRSQMVVEMAARQFLLKVSYAATIGVYVFAGIPAAVGLSLDLAALRVDTHVLMNLAVIGALVTGHPLEGALLLILFQGSHAVEHLLTDRAQGSLQALYDSVPETVKLTNLLDDGSPDLGSILEKKTDDVEIGEIVLVKPGWQVPLDGCIVHGRALVSAELISGESIPTLYQEDDEVAAGSLCLDGILAIRVLRTAADSTPARIARLAKEAQARRPKLRTWLDKFGEIYSKAVIVVSFMAFAILLYSGVPLFGVPGVDRGALYRAMSLLTVASPCALVMVPLAYVSAIAAAASRGVILKGGRVLDAIDACRVIALDKTGTVTTGTLRLANLLKLERQSGLRSTSTTGRPVKFKKIDKDVLLAAIALSIRSTHPVSDATVQFAGQHGLSPRMAPTVKEFTLIPGGGVSGQISLSHARNAEIADKNMQTSENFTRDYRCYFGSLDFIANHLTQDEEITVQRQFSHHSAGSIVSLLLLDPIEDKKPITSDIKRQIWAFVYEDTVRSRSMGAIDTLQKGSWATEQPTARRACRVLMLTGDNEASATKVAKVLGIKEVFAGLSPENKQEQVVELQDTRQSSTRGGVIMVGDGLNDAAALATADVGIAIASNGAAATSLAADAVIIGDAIGISTIPMLLRLARATRYVIRQNLALAAGSIAVLALPAILGSIPMWLAVMLHEGTTLLVALNSLRLLRFSASAFRRTRRDVQSEANVAHSGSSQVSQIGSNLEVTI